jgi:NitT/TauT family transport system permease protein
MPFALLNHMGFKETEIFPPAILTPNQSVNRSTRRLVVLAWVVCTAVAWFFSPFVFLPKPSEVFAALHDLWFYQALGVELFSSVCLNLEAIAIATIISLVLAYLGTIPAITPAVSFIGKLRFLSLAGLGFAFTLMTSNGHSLRISVLVFMVVVFFVVSMVDVIQSIPKEQFDLAHTLHMGPWESLWEVVILGQIDQAFVVLRQTAAMSFMFIATAESMSMSGGGIGMLLTTATKHFHLAEIMAMQIVILILGLAQDSMIGYLRRLCCPYADLQRGNQ